jgi:hypothetical protein
MQRGLFNRALYLNPNRCEKLEHKSKPATHVVEMPTSNPRKPVRSFQVCSACARDWERVRGANVTKIHGEVA